MTEPHKDMDELLENLAEDIKDAAASAKPMPRPQLRPVPGETKEIVSEAQAERVNIKNRLSAAYAQARKDVEFCTGKIVEADRAIRMHQINRDGLEGMLGEARERMLKARYAMIRFIEDEN